jgi:hypothetical protein
VRGPGSVGDSAQGAGTTAQGAGTAAHEGAGTAAQGGAGTAAQGAGTAAQGKARALAARLRLTGPRHVELEAIVVREQLQRGGVVGGRSRADGRVLRRSTYGLFDGWDPRARHFPRGSLSKVADSFEPYPTNMPHIRGTCGTCTSAVW